MLQVSRPNHQPRACEMAALATDQRALGRQSARAGDARGFASAQLAASRPVQPGPSGYLRLITPATVHAWGPRAGTAQATRPFGGKPGQIEGKCRYWNSQGSVPSRDGGRIRHRLMGTILNAPFAITIIRKHACAPRLSAYPSCISSDPRLRGGYGALLTDLAGPIGKES